jgi:DNA end-binding protein Ku
VKPAGRTALAVVTPLDEVLRAGEPAHEQPQPGSDRHATDEIWRERLHSPDPLPRPSRPESGERFKRTLHFSYVHEPNGGRIGYQKVCKAEDRPVPDAEVVKAFEVEKGRWVYLSDEDFEAAEQQQGSKTIDIHAFVAQEEIDPIYFERTYYLTAQEGGEKVYALLARAMEESGLVAVATFVMREREHLACLRVRDRVVTLERMYFADEIRPVKGLAPKGVRVAKEELEMAARLVEQYAGSFRPERFKDTYRDALLRIIRAKERAPRFGKR